MKTLQNLFLSELADMYDAEHRIVKALPKMVKAASAESLKAAFRAHLKQTQGHVKKLKQVFQCFDTAATGKTCDATVGLLEEGDGLAAEFEGSPAIDAALIAAAQKVEHYEMASYGCLHEWAGLLGNEKAAAILEVILDEERAANAALTGLARANSNKAALNGHHANGSRKPLAKRLHAANRMRLGLLVPWVCLALLPLAASHAASDKAGGTFSLYLENDLFAGTDRQYTSGVKLGWSSADLSDYRESAYAAPFLPVFDRLPYINDKSFQKNLVFALGQNIYTPDDTETFDVVKNDRPYAGWLYLGVGVVWKNASVRNSVVLNVGVVGPWSYSQESQRAVHDLRGLGHPNGWDNQLHNELGVVLHYQREWRWPEHTRRVGLDWELIPHAGIALGNVLDGANLGGELRVGWNLPDDFGTAVIDSASTTSTPVDGPQGAQRSRFDLGAYLFARADGRLVAHNIFLDGNTFGNSPSVDHKWLVADLSVGAAVNFKNTKFAYAFVYRTPEFEGQEDGQVFGTVSVNLTF